jgi:hypothetical protein
MMIQRYTNIDSLNTDILKKIRYTILQINGKLTLLGLTLNLLKGGNALWLQLKILLKSLA